MSQTLQSFGWQGGGGGSGSAGSLVGKSFYINIIETNTINWSIGNSRFIVPLQADAAGLIPFPSSASSITLSGKNLGGFAFPNIKGSTFSTIHFQGTLRAIGTLSAAEYSLDVGTASVSADDTSATFTYVVGDRFDLSTTSDGLTLIDSSIDVSGAANQLLCFAFRQYDAYSSSVALRINLTISFS